MAKRVNGRACRHAALAAAGCLALLLAGCSGPVPRQDGHSLPATGGSTGSSTAPLALLPAPIPGTAPAAGSAAAGKSAPSPAATSADTGIGPEATGAGSADTVMAYFVLVDDGGRHGIRFGCNDSLVGAARTVSTGDTRLQAAIGALLGGEQQPKNLYYNALDSSRLKFLSGSFDGTTVTVYLAGTLNPGGTCDIPRVEAQLTQTALEAVGAVTAKIYINGETLADYLKLK